MYDNTESTFVESRLRLYKYFHESSEIFVKTNSHLLSKEELSAELHFLGNTIYYATVEHTISQQIQAVQYLKYSYEIDLDDQAREQTYREALSHLVLEIIREKIHLLHKNDNAKFKEWTKSIKKTFTKIDAIPYEELTYENFFYNYSLKRIPLVIKGLANVMARNKTFDLKYLQNKCKDMQVTKQIHIVNDVQNWAGLAGMETTTIGDFVDDIFSNINTTTATLEDKGKIPYIFDEGLSAQGNGGCGQLLNDLTIPKYFTQDIGRMMTTKRYDTHPSLFVGPKNSSCGLHVDSSSSNFWQALFLGRKKWYVVLYIHLSFLSYV